MKEDPGRREEDLPQQVRRRRQLHIYIQIHQKDLKENKYSFFLSQRLRVRFLPSVPMCWKVSNPTAQRIMTLSTQTCNFTFWICKDYLTTKTHPFILNILLWTRREAETFTKTPFCFARGSIIHLTNHLRFLESFQAVQIIRHMARMLFNFSPLFDENLL